MRAREPEERKPRAAGMAMPWASGFAAAAMRSSLSDFQAAAERLSGEALRLPLLPFSSAGRRTIRLKPENLQPLGSFKIRAGTNALAALGSEALQGVATVSAGNFAQGLAFAARRRGINLTAYVPANAAAIKLDALRELGANVVPVSAADWMQIAFTRETGANDGIFIHPVCEPAVIHGNGTIGLELAEEWPELDTVVVPIGGGGLAAGVALALREAGRKVRIVACEVEGAAPLAAAREVGRPVVIERQLSFIDAVGSTTILDAMWPLLEALVDEVVVVPLADVEAALRLLATRHHVIVEGAGALALAAALSPRCGGRNVAVLLSGGNIDSAQLCRILADSSTT